MPPATYPADGSRAASSSCRCCRRRRRPREASHQILIGQLGNRDWYLLSERRSPSSAGCGPVPKQPGASKGATTSITAPAYWKFESSPLQQTVGLSLDFSFLYRKAGSCRGVRGPGQATRPAETPGLVNITPTAGNVSVGRFSSTALPARAVRRPWLQWYAKRARVAAKLSDLTRL